MRPLDDIVVLDLTRVVSGPYCTMILGDLGADVIKIERPGEGDDTRGFAPPYQGDQAAYFLSVNRNKRSLTLDLKSPGGADVLWRLIARADVLVENFRPGVMERLGFGYDAIRERRPELIYCAISGFGQTGPERDRPGYDVVVQAEAGIMDITGPAEGAPHKVGTSIADLVTGQTAANAVLAALLVRGRTGEGQFIDISMLEATAALLTFNASIYYATGQTPKRRGNAHPTIVPYEAFQTADGAWLNLGIANDTLWRTFCDVAERPELAVDARYATAPARVAARDELVPLVADILSAKSRDEWIGILGAAGVPAAAIRTVGETCESETLKARDMIAEMRHPTAGVVKGIKSAMRFGDTRLDGYMAPPCLGQHSDAILSEVADLNAEEIARLKSAGVV